MLAFQPGKKPLNGKKKEERFNAWNEGTLLLTKPKHIWKMAKTTIKQCRNCLILSISI